jgi:hypothetical protein
VLATLFSDQHRELFERCRTTGESLDAAEKATFGLSYGEAGACLLSAWRIPAEARLPLEYITRMFNELTPLSEPVRHCVETVKLSILLARIAVCCWEAWDVVDLPRASTLKRLCTESVAVTLSKIRERCETSVASHSHRPAILQEHGTPPANSEVLYLSPIEDSQDLLRSLVSSLGLTVRDSLETSAANSQRVLINGVLTSGIQLSNFIKTCKSQDLLGIIRKNEDASLFDPNATICLPTTVRNLLEFFAI